ncbi:MAG: cupredoxin domain-containing protein [Anaerolineaceae bacterium]
MKRFTRTVKHIAGDQKLRGILLWGVLAALIVWAPLPHAGGTPERRTIHIEASRFSFTPGEIHVNPGDEITVELVSTDVVHGLSLDGHDLNMTADPGQPVTATFVAGPAGVYRFRCSAACGNLHPFMIGKLRVGSNLPYWRGLVLALAAAAGAMLHWKPSPRAS